MIKRMKCNVKYVVLGVLIFVLAMGFTFVNYKDAKAAGREEPLSGYTFSLVLDGAVKGYFTEAHNIGSENEIVEQKVTNDKGQKSVKLSGRLKILDITLTRGITNNMDLAKWRQMVVAGDSKGAHKNGSIVMYDKALKAVAQWDFAGAWPSKLICNPVDASATSSTGGMGIESVTIAVESILRVK
jgi:phage tail-like protein